MKLTSVFAILSAAALPCLALSGSVKVTYDNMYDNPQWSLDQTACSNGVNGLYSKYPTLGDIPRFPYVGGIPGLVWNSTLCGTCWQLTYTTPSGVTNKVTVVAVDASYTFNIAEEALVALGGSAGVAAGSVIATAARVSC